MDTALYYKYWDTELKEVSSLLDEYNAIDIKERLSHYTEIRHQLPAFFSYLIDLKSPSFDELKASHYMPILKFIGYDHYPFFKKILEMDGILNFEQRELALEDFLKIHPENIHALFEVACLEAGSAYQRAIDVGTGKQVRGVVRLHAPAVLHPNRLRGFRAI